MTKAVIEVPTAADIQYRHLIRNDSGHCFMTTVNWDNSDSVSSCVRVADSISCGGFIGQGNWRGMLILALRTVWWTLCTDSQGGISGQKIDIALITLFYLENVELYVLFQWVSLNKVLWNSKILYLFIIFFLWRCGPTRVTASSLLRFLDHTKQLTTFGRTSLDEWSARRRDLYLTTYNTHKTETSMSPAEFEPTIAGSERLQTHALNRAATGIGLYLLCHMQLISAPWIIINIFWDVTLCSLVEICRRFERTVCQQQITQCSFTDKVILIYHSEKFISHISLAIVTPTANI